MHAAVLTIMLAVAGGSDGSECECGKHGRHGGHGNRRASQNQSGHSQPQVCYAPRYGCYYSNNRHMHRYPAFHGVYYRRPYNYRNLFDYPWHARLHEPTSLYSYNVPEEPLDAPPLLPPVQPSDDPPAPVRDDGSAADEGDLDPVAQTDQRAAPRRRRIRSTLVSHPDESKIKSLASEDGE